MPTIELNGIQTAVPAQTATPPSTSRIIPPTPAPPRRRRHVKRWLLTATATTALVGLAWYFAFGRTAKTQYNLAAVDRGDIDSTITATGNCNAVVTVQVGSQVSGNISALYADFNTKVKQNQLVARIDPAMFQARVDQASANLESAKAAVVTAHATVKKAESDIANAEANVATQNANVVHAQSAVNDAKTKNARSVELVKEGIIAQDDADTAQATYDQAVAALDAANAQVRASQAAVESAKAELEVAQTQLDAAGAVVKQGTAALQQAQLDLTHTEIRAPVDGTVVSRNMDVGQTVAASFQAPTIFLIAQDLTKMQVDTNVDESDVGPVRVGQRANFTVDAYPGVIFPGAVAQIRQAPINVQNVVTYDVVVAVNNADLKLFPGHDGEREDPDRPGCERFANSRSRTAIPSRRQGRATRKTQDWRERRRQDASATNRLCARPTGQPKPVRVQLGLSDGNYLQVLSGLTEGQRVIVGAVSKSAPSTSSPVGGTRRMGF